MIEVVLDVVQWNVIGLCFRCLSCVDDDSLIFCRWFIVCIGYFSFYNFFIIEI